MGSWSQQLRALREKVGLTRRELAELAAVAPATVKAYELAQRNPSRDLLGAMLTALKADMFMRAAILEAAGFVPDGATPSQRAANEYFTMEEAIAEIQCSPFPACVSTEMLEVQAANPLLQAVWQVDLQQAERAPFQRSMMSMLSHRGVADRIENWDEAIGLVISILKGNYGGETAFTKANPYFSAAFERFMDGESQYVQRFLSLWDSTPPRQRKLRFAYPIRWRHPAVGTLSFLVQVNPADARGGIVFNDWIPVDAATWTGLDQLRRSLAARGAAAAV